MESFIVRHQETLNVGRDISVGGNSHASVKPKSVKHSDLLDASLIVKLLPNLNTYMSRNNSLQKGLCHLLPLDNYLKCCSAH